MANCFKRAGIKKDGGATATCTTVTAAQARSTPAPGRRRRAVNVSTDEDEEAVDDVSDLENDDAVEDDDALFIPKNRSAEVGWWSLVLLHPKLVEMALGWLSLAFIIHLLKYKSLVSTAVTFTLVSPTII